MGIFALIVAFIAGNVVMFRIFASRRKGMGAHFTSAIWSATAAFLTMLVVFFLLFGLGNLLGLARSG